MNHSPLGKKVTQPKGHDPRVLYPMPRISCETVHYGYDLWRSYELSWLDGKGKPRIGILELVYPVQSTFIVESKSLKLYLGGLSCERFDTAEKVEETIMHDLKDLLVPEWILVHIIEQAGFPGLIIQPHPDGTCLDNLDIQIQGFQRDPDFLTCMQELCEETLYSDLFKTNCPITGQPDWGSVAISYRGKAINHEALLKYLCSYRAYQGFAEEVCERIFSDITKRCEPEMLKVGCFYTRRGGIDINPFRSSHPIALPEINRGRLIRQ